MPIDLRDALKWANTKSARAAEKRKAESEQREREAQKPLVIAKIAEFGSYSDEEKEIIFKVNDMVMGVDGTAEQWGGYHYDPLDYIETSVEIFDLIKSFCAASTK